MAKVCNPCTCHTVDNPTGVGVLISYVKCQAYHSGATLSSQLVDPESTVSICAQKGTVTATGCTVTMSATECGQVNPTACGPCPPSVELTLGFSQVKCDSACIYEITSIVYVNAGCNPPVPGCIFYSDDCLQNPIGNPLSASTDLYFSNGTNCYKYTIGVGVITVDPC